MQKLSLLLVAACLAATTSACQKKSDYYDDPPGSRGSLIAFSPNSAKQCINGVVRISDELQEIQGSARTRLLTTDAKKAKVRIFRSGSDDISETGRISLFYLNGQKTCILWMESLTLAQYSLKLGLSMDGITSNSRIDDAPERIEPVMRETR